MNMAVLMGNVGKDPVFKRIGVNDTPVMEFSVATGFKGEKRDTTQWHNVKLFGKTAENCKDKVYKGARVLLRGEIQYRSWEKDGQKKYMTEIVAYECRSLSPKTASTEAIPDAALPHVEGDLGDGLPF